MNNPKLQKKLKKFVVFIKFFLICLKSLKAFHVHNKKIVDCPYCACAHKFIFELKFCTLNFFYLFVHVLKIIFVLLFGKFWFQLGFKFVTSWIGKFWTWFFGNFLLTYGHWWYMNGINLFQHKPWTLNLNFCDLKP